MEISKERMEIGILPVMLEEGARMPLRVHPDDAGLDLFSSEDADLPPRGHVTVRTGLHVMIPEGFVGLLTSRSGLMQRHGVTSAGTIDAGYTGEIRAVLFNHTDDRLFLPAGTRVTQLVLLPIATPRILKVDVFPATERGAKGFGSSGNDEAGTKLPEANCAVTGLPCAWCQPGPCASRREAQP